jgi:hypothetical protein
VTALKSEQLNFRVLIAYRSYKDIIASRIQRKPRKEDGKKSNEFAPSFYTLLRSGEVEKITEFYRTYRWCKEALLIDIQELITSKDKELREITFWLGLDELKRPYIDYFLGEILSRKYSFSNAINDEVKFSSLEKLTLHTHRCLSILFPFGAFVLNLKSVLAIFYKRWIQAKMNVK